MVVKLRGIAIALAVMFTTLAVANAATIHVNETGWWFEGGSFNASDNPIQSAVNNARDGDLILIEPGNYVIENTIDVSKAVSIVGNGTMDDVVIEAKNVDVFYIHDKVSTTEIRNLTIVDSWSWRKGIYIKNYRFFEISNVNVSAYYGVYAENSSLSIEYSKISANIAVDVKSNSYVEVKNCDVFDKIYISRSSGIVSNNHVRGRIYVYHSSPVTISGNYIEVYKGDYYHWKYGMYVDNSDVSIKDNIVKGLSKGYNRGIYIGGANGFSVENNTIMNLEYGLNIAYSSNGLFKNNNMTDNTYNIRFDGNNIDHYVHTFIDNVINGKPIYYYVNANGVNVPSDAGFVGIVNSKNVHVSGFSISKNYQGLLIVNSSDVYIEGYVHNCYRGMEIKWSDNVTFSGEIYKDSYDYYGDGIYIFKSNAKIFDSKISQTTNSRYGIYADRSSVTVENVTVDGFSRGIWLYNSQNCLIKDSTFNRGLILSDTSHTTITNCSITTSGIGIEMSNSDNNTIEHCTLMGGEALWTNGIYIHSSSQYNVISSNTIRSYDNGIRLTNSDNNVIEDNLIEDNKYGILIEPYKTDYAIYESENNSLYGNEIRNNEFGLKLDRSENTVMRNNILENNEYNFGVRGDKLSHFIHDIDTSNTINGKPIYYIVDQSYTTVDSSSNAGYVAVVNSDHVTIKDLSIGNNIQCILTAYSKDCSIENITAYNFSIAGIDIESSENVSVEGEAYNAGGFSYAAGVRLYNSSHCAVECYAQVNKGYSRCGAYLEKSDYNTIMGVFVNNRYGIYMRYSSFNYIEGNVSDNNHGVYLDHSNSNVINNSTIIHNYYGIYLAYSSYNEIRNCNVSLSYIYYGDGIYITSSDNNVIENCTLIRNADCGIELSGNDNVIANSTIVNNGNGIRINSGSGNVLEGNEISYSNKGIHVKSQHNTIAFNNITNNYYGIYLTNNYNDIYLNNFIDNTQQAYSSGVNTWKSFNASYEYNGSNYISYLGNYWSDYSGSDADGDGIGDTPYVIDDNDADYYPLIATKENYLKVAPVPPPKYKVSGWIHYEGWDYGEKIYVFAKNSTTHEIVNYTDLSSLGSYPKFYEFELPNGSYYIEAYMDMNGNNLFDEENNEPWGYAINKNPYAKESADTIEVSGTAVSNVNLTLMRLPPKIRDYNPDESVIENNAGESRSFWISSDQRVNVIWYINNSIVKEDSKVTYSAYLNESAKPGVWEVRAVIENAFGSDEHKWIWIVKALISCDASGNPKDSFAPGECVYVKGINLEPNTEYKIWIQPEPVTNGKTLNPSDDPSGEQETVITNDKGEFGPVAIWCIDANATATYQKWDIIADKGGDGIYSSSYDAIDSVTTYGFVAPIPELATILLALAGIFALVRLKNKN